MKKKKKFISKILIIAMIIILIISISIFILKKVVKNNKNGNNMSSQEIVDYILNINSYKAIIYVETTSNKNDNKYIINQEYNTQNGDIEEIIEPTNISGIKIIKQNNTLKIENSKFNLNTIFENYNELNNNSLDLSTFINDYKNSEKSKYEENESEIIMRTECNNENKYIHNKALYINKSNNLPNKLIIKDNNQKETINIKYNEIEFN